METEWVREKERLLSPGLFARGTHELNRRVRESTTAARSAGTDEVSAVAMLAFAGGAAEEVEVGACKGGGSKGQGARRER